VNHTLAELPVRQAPPRRRAKPSITRRDLLPDLIVAAAAVTAMTGLHFLILPWLGTKPPLILFSVMAAALTFWRGLGPGMLAIALGTPVGSLLLQASAPANRPPSIPLESSLMFGGSMFICWMIYRLRVEQETVDQMQGQKEHALAFVSHELRQPLATVHLAAAMLERDGSDESRYRAAELISRSAARLSKVVEDLVDVTRLQGEGLRIERASMRLQDAISAASDAVAPSIAHRKQYLELNSPVDPPLWINGDAARLQQVFENLLSNASRYSPEGAEISLSVLEHRGRAQVSVRDTGIGISRDMLERIFEPFVRETYSGVEGLGIGLTLVRNLVLAHGGTVSARSDGPGRGSEFIVELPLQPAQEAQRGRNAEQRLSLAREDRYTSLH
jgi:signal transduction histidine kinase